MNIVICKKPALFASFLVTTMLIVSLASSYTHACNNCDSNGKIGNCALLPPSAADNTGLVCANNTWGVTYNGYLASKVCYSRLEDAMGEMRSMAFFCQQSAKKGNCALLPPGAADNSGLVCANDTWGVTYNGYLASKVCYSRVEDAMREMDQLSGGSYLADPYFSVNRPRWRRN